MRIADPHSYADGTQPDIAHISFRIHVDFPAHILQVQAVYELDRPVTGSFFLDTRDILIENIVCEGKPVPWELDKDDPVLGQRLHLKELTNCQSLAIRFSTSSQATALQWLTPTQTAGGRAPFMYSQCFPLHARSIFPCQDSPAVRFTYDAVIIVPKPLTAVMAAASIGSSAGPDSERFEFSMPQPVPAYLFAFAVGELTFKAIGPRTGVYAERELVDAAAWEFAENEQKLAEAERLLGPYLWDRFDMLIMPPSFPYGGMENPRLTFLSPVTIIGDRSRSHVVSHELAHAWTGNLITNATWEDFWLNEGWTTYAESRITEVVSGADMSQLQLLQGRNMMLEDMRRLGFEDSKTALKLSLKDQDPDEHFSTIPYVKGCLFILALERAVGREQFDGFLKKYIAAYRFDALATEEFLSFLQQELPAAADLIDVGRWIYEPGFPEDAPALRSTLYNQVAGQVTAYEQGALPERQDVSHWIQDQVQLFLQLLEKSIPVEHCRYLDDLFDLEHKQHASILTTFYLLSLRSDYRDIMPRIEQFVARVGSFGSITRIFRCMTETEWSRELARPLLEKYRAYHHPITVKRIDQLLADAQL